MQNYPPALDPRAKRMADALFRDKTCEGNLTAVFDKLLQVNSIGAIPKTAGGTSRL